MSSNFRASRLRSTAKPLLLISVAVAQSSLLKPSCVSPLKYSISTGRGTLGGPVISKLSRARPGNVSDSSVRNTNRNATLGLPARKEISSEYLVKDVVLFEVSEKYGSLRGKELVAVVPLQLYQVAALYPPSRFQVEPLFSEY